MRLLAEERLDDLLHLGHARLAADQDDLVHVARLQVRVGQRLLHRLQGPLHQVVYQTLQLGPGQRDVEVLRPRLVRGDERQVDLRLHHRRQLALGLLRRLLEPLQRHRVLRQVNPLVALELADQPVNHPLVEVVAPQVRVAVGALDLEHPLGQLKDGDVVSAAPEIVDRDLLFLLLVEAVRQRRRRRLVDDPHHVEAGDLARVLGGLPLGIVEVRGDRHDRLLDLVAEIVLRRLTHLLEDHRRDLRRRVPLAADLDRRQVVLSRGDLVGHAPALLDHLAGPPAHEPLDREDRVERIGDRLPLGHLAYQPLAVLGEGDDRGRRATALGVRDHDRISALHHRDNGVGGSQVYADDFLSHGSISERIKGRCARRAQRCRCKGRARV